MSNEGTSVRLSPLAREVVESLVRSGLTPQRVAERARIVLLSAEGQSNLRQAVELGVDRQRIRRWRNRWAAASAELVAAEAEEPDAKDFAARVLAVLEDNARSGTPPTFSPQQMAAIIALACEPPADSDLPVSHWTPTELALEAVKRGIVESISARQVDRFLARRTSGPTGASTG